MLRVGVVLDEVSRGAHRTVRAITAILDYGHDKEAIVNVRATIDSLIARRQSPRHLVAGLDGAAERSHPGVQSMRHVTTDQALVEPRGERAVSAR